MGLTFNVFTTITFPVTYKVSIDMDSTQGDYTIGLYEAVRKFEIEKKSNERFKSFLYLNYTTAKKISSNEIRLTLYGMVPTQIKTHSINAIRKMLKSSIEMEFDLKNKIGDYKILGYTVKCYKHSTNMQEGIMLTTVPFRGDQLNKGMKCYVDKLSVDIIWGVTSICVYSENGKHCASIPLKDVEILSKKTTKVVFNYAERFDY